MKSSTLVADLSTQDANLKDFITKSINGAFDTAIVIHNVGSTGQGKATREMDDGGAISSYYALNVVGPVTLNALFLEATKDIKRRIVVNVSSLLGLQPVPSFGLYCSGKYFVI